MEGQIRNDCSLSKLPALDKLKTYEHNKIGVAEHGEVLHDWKIKKHLALLANKKNQSSNLIKNRLINLIYVPPTLLKENDFFLPA